MGQAAKGLFDLPGIDTMADRVALEIEDVRRIGPDLRIRARPDL
jgi:diaminohydroxyphosphoribosylaminopyrimidine deaminase/5-amino-6-(5-phosphoribosylamino)uracil reductase